MCHTTATMTSSLARAGRAARRAGSMSTAPEPREPTLSGWLHKTRRGIMLAAATKKHRRWFVLEEASLSWFSDEPARSAVAESHPHKFDDISCVLPEETPKGREDVRGAIVTTTKARKFTLEFATGRRDKLEAATQEEADKWVSVRASRGGVAHRQPPPPRRPAAPFLSPPHNALCARAVPGCPRAASWRRPS